MVDSERKAAIISSLRADYEATLAVLLVNRASGLARRNFVKTTFSFIEAALWALRQICLDPDLLQEHNITLTTGEIALLNEESYDLKDNGDVKSGPKFLHPGSGFKFTFKTLEKVLDANFAIDYDDRRWADFLGSVKVRNRLTHPKLDEENEVTDDELSACTRALEFYTVAYESFTARFRKVVAPMRMRGEMAMTQYYAQQQAKNNTDKGS